MEHAITVHDLIVWGLGVLAIGGVLAVGLAILAAIGSGFSR